VVQGDWQKIRHLNKHPAVKAIHPVQLVQKFLHDSTQIINADDAWSLTDSTNQSLTGTGITVAVIDTGVDYSHEDLGGCFGAGCKVESGYDFVENDEDPMDVDGHGTHVAGIIAANGSLKGVAPGASIMALRVLDDEGFGSSSDIIAALEYAVDPDDDLTTDDGADVINLSLGGPGEYQSPGNIAVENAVAAGIVVVAAAGNYGSYGDIAGLSPASALSAITVTSSTKQDQVSGFSSKGGGASYQQLKPEIIAPGSDIVSLQVGGGNVTLSGTSMAAPHVAGAAAILKQKFPDATPQDIKARMVSSAIDIGADAYSQGYGRLDVTGALAQAVTIFDAGLAFGRVDDSQSEIQYSAYVDIKNDSAQAVTFDLVLPDGLPEQVEIQTTQTELTVAANSQERFEFTVLVTSPKDIATPDNISTTYFSALQFISPDLSLTVPATLERGYRLTLTHDGLNPAGLSVDSVDGLNFAYDYIFPEETRTIFTPETEVYIRVQHELEPSEIAHLNIPERGEDVTVLVDGYEEHVLVMDSNKSLNLSPSNLIHLVGLGAAVDEQSVDILSSALTATTNLFSFIEFSQNIGFVSVEYRSQLFFNSLDPAEKVAYYTALGSIEDKIDSRLVEQVRFPALRSDDSDTFVQLVHDLNSTQDLLKTFTQGEKPEITLTGLADTDIPYVAADLSANSTLLPSFYLATDKNEIQFTQLTGSSQDFAARLHLGFANEFGTGWMTPYASSESFNFTLQSDINPVSQTNVIEDFQYQFNASGLTMSKPIEVGTDYLMDLRGFHFTNGRGQAYHAGVNAQYSLACGNGDELTGPFDTLSLYLNTSQCDVSSLTINWQTSLYGESYQSSATYDIAANTGPVFPGLISAIFEDGEVTTDLIISGQQNTVYLASDVNFNSLNLISLEYKLDDGQWQSLTTESSDLVEFNHMATLPTGYLESQVLSLRISYADNGDLGSVTQEINGGYSLQPPASGAKDDLDGDGIVDAEDDDIDGDGIPNEVEEAYELDPRDASDASEDLDNDGLSNLQEYLLGTSMVNSDSDGDGIPDGEDDFPLVSASAVAFDYDGDGKADIGVRRPSNTMQYILQSSNEGILRERFGLALNDIPVSGDFDGDGVADVAVRRPSNQYWYIKNSSDGEIQRFNFGKQAEDIPVPADYDGDGITDIAVRRPSNQYWYILNSSDGEIQRFNFGKQEGDIPVPADYDGDGKADIAVRRPSNHTWYILRSSDNEIERIVFGRDEADIPVPADYDGDGKADVAVRRASNQYFYILNSSDGEIQRFNFGKQVEDIPIVADYDGDGKADVAVRRPSTQYQYILRSSDGEIERHQFGRNSADIPLAGPVLTRMAMAAAASN